MPDDLTRQGRPLVAAPLQCSYTHCAEVLHENLSDTWRFTFKIELAQHRSGTKTAPKSAFYVRTNALSDMVFWPAQELFGIV